MEPNNAVAAAVRTMVDAVNSGDFAGAIAAFTEAPVIIEDLAPYLWRGADAPSNWLSAMGANAARLNVQSVLMAVEQPTRVEVDAQVAYAVIPGELRLAGEGGDLFAKGVLTLTLQCVCGRWLIDALVWSGPEPAPR